MQLSEFNVERNIPSLSGKTIVITGGTAGLGAATISALAAHNPSHIYFTGRNQKSAENLLSTWHKDYPNTPIEFVKCDLQSLASVAEAASDLLSKLTKLDILITNAGIMAVPGAVTKDGYESQFGTNHVGHALFIRKLLPSLLSAAHPRLVTLSSQGYGICPGSGISYQSIKPESGEFSDGWLLGKMVRRGLRYGYSKMANILYPEELEKRYPKISTIAVHPGVITENGLVQDLGMVEKCLTFATTVGRVISVQDGAKNTCWAATCGPGDLDGHVYAEPVGKVMQPSGWPKEKRAEHGKKLWEWTEKELQPWL